MNHSPLFKVPDIAKYLGKGNNFVYEAIRQHKLEAIQLGKSFRITEVALQQFIKSCSSVQQPLEAINDAITH